MQQARCLALERALGQARAEYEHHQSVLGDETEAERTIQSLLADARRRESDYNIQLAETQQWQRRWMEAQECQRAESLAREASATSSRQEAETQRLAFERILVERDERHRAEIESERCRHVAELQRARDEHSTQLRRTEELSLIHI